MDIEQKLFGFWETETRKVSFLFVNAPEADGWWPLIYKLDGIQEQRQFKGLNNNSILIRIPKENKEVVQEIVFEHSKQISTYIPSGKVILIKKR